MKIKDAGDPRTARWTALLNALINFHHNMSRASAALGIANSTFASWRRRKSADLNLLVPLIAKERKCDDLQIVEYLAGGLSLQDIFGADYSPALENPVVIRPRGVTKKKAKQRPGASPKTSAISAPSPVG